MSLVVRKAMKRHRERKAAEQAAQAARLPLFGVTREMKPVKTHDRRTRFDYTRHENHEAYLARREATRLREQEELRKQLGFA